VAWLTLRSSVPLDYAVVIAGPLLADRVHAVGPPGGCDRLAVMTAEAVGNGADVTLNLHALDVVVAVQRRIFGMGAVVASLTL
jgi:hypothetical protein